MKLIDSMCARQCMNFKTNIKILLNPDMTSFKVYRKKQYQDYDNFIKELSDVFDFEMGKYYFCDKDYVDNYLFVKVWSSRNSAIYTSNLISNQTKHKLKHIELLHGKWILMAFKDKSKCNDWA